MRVPRQPPSKRHPLTGLYKADYGSNGIQVFAGRFQTPINILTQ